MEDGGRYVLPFRAFVQQGLHIRLGEYAATAGNGIDGAVALRQLIQTARIRIQERRHLVYESAGAIHALLDATVEVDDLGVFSAQFDGYIRCGDERFYSGLGGDDLLDELHV